MTALSLIVGGVHHCGACGANRYCRLISRHWLCPDCEAVQAQVCKAQRIQEDKELERKFANRILELDRELLEREVCL